MAARIRRHPRQLTAVALAVLVAWAIVAIPAAAQSAETPRRGGILLAAIAAAYIYFTG